MHHDVLKIERKYTNGDQPGSRVYLEHLSSLTATWLAVEMCPSPFVEVGSPRVVTRTRRSSWCWCQT